jgi:hypothetical protein
MPVTEYGIFTEEGCIEAGYWDYPSAEAQAELYRAEAETEEIDETYTAKEMCEEHRDAEFPRGECEECWDAEEGE